MEEKQKVPFYKKTWFIVLSMFIFFPLGLVLMWLFTDWSKHNKWIITAVVLLFAIVINPTDETKELADSEEDQVAAVTAEESQNEKASEDNEEVATEKKEEVPEEEETTEDAFAESRQGKKLTDEEKAEREESAAEYKKEQEEKEQEEKNQEQDEVVEEIVEDSEVEEVVDEEDQTPEQEIEYTIIESLGEDNITELNITEYDGSFEVDVTFTASENFTANMTANGIKRDIVDTTLELKEIDHYVSYLLITATLPLTDDLGNESDGQAMSASFNGETIEKLNEDNELFLYDNLENAADGFSAHPQFR